MADPLRSADDADRPGPVQPASLGLPRWAIVALVILAVALLGLVVLLHVTGIIGPGTHTAARP